MKHSDLRDRLRNADPGLIKFCENFCRKDFVCDSPSDDEKKILAILSGDEISKAQFVEHLRHEQTRNLFESASYYRSFFDRFSSYVNSRVHREKHKWLYREKDLKNVYRDVQKSDEKIRKMEQFRQNNPLIHASSKALESPTFEADLLSVISSIESIISEYIKNVSIEMIA